MILAHTRSAAAAAVVFVPLFAGIASAQCSSHWLPGPGLAGLGMAPSASTTWDPDGSGPLGPHVVMAGRFKVAADAPAEGVAMVDPATGKWTALASSFDGSIECVAVMGGDLIVAGAFTSIDNVLAQNIARFDGATWSRLGPGVSNVVNQLAVAPNGDLFVGGAFTVAGGVVVDHVARWDGSAWHGIGGGVNGTVQGMTVLPNGDLVVIGVMTSAGGGTVPVYRAARWDGGIWSRMGGGPNLFLYFDLYVNSAGELYAAGAGPALQRWNGTSWIGMPPLPGDCYVVRELPNGDLIAGGRFVAATPSGEAYLARWDGANWQPLSGPDGAVTAMAVLAGDRTVIGGRFRQVDAQPAVHVGLWTPHGSYPLATGSDGNVVAMNVLSNGDLVGGGGFRVIDGIPAGGLARFDGVRWHPYGGGANGAVRAIVEFPNGDLVVAGEFTSIDGVAADRIARFDGVGWSPLGSGIDGRVHALALTPTGDLIAGGHFQTAGGVICNHVARWDGASWHGMAGGMDNIVYALTTTPTGDVVAGGRFVNAGGNAALRVASWDGSGWSAIGAGLGHSTSFETVYAIEWFGGRLVAGGGFQMPPTYALGGVAEWDGQNWVAIGGGLVGGGGTVYSLGELPNGNLVMGGDLYSTNPLPDRYLVRWDGANWHAVGGAVDNIPWAMAMHGVATLAVGGVFRRIGGNVAAGFARFRTSCPAAASEVLTPCVGPAGPLTLTANSGPWVGTTIELSTSGFAAQSFGAAVIGLTSPGTPLGLLHPTGLPNCQLLASLDSVGFVLPNSGLATMPLTIPNDPAFGGVVLHAQFLQAGLIGGAVQTLSGSNGLRLEIGVF